MGVCNPLQWRNRPRFSRGFRTFGCDDDEPLGPSNFKERDDCAPAEKFCQEKTHFINNVSPSRESLALRLSDGGKLHGNAGPFPDFAGTSRKSGQTSRHWKTAVSSEAQ